MRYSRRVHAAAVLLSIYALIFVLHLVLPARWVDGYVVDPPSGRPLRYRLNGLRVMVASLLLYGLAGVTGVLPWDYLYVQRWTTLATACALGLGFTAAIVLTARPRGGLLADLFLGRRDNPRWGGGFVDAKMFLYVLGAVMLALNLLSFAAHHASMYPGGGSPGVWLHLGLFLFFLCEYLYFERVHLYTYDLFAERVGFKLGWGCMVFYPFFYACGLWSAAELPPAELPPGWGVACAGLFFTGWGLSRGANLQKFWFKVDPRRRAFGVLAPIALEQRVLVNGFWGLSRHVNYLGEILMAVGLTLALGHPQEIGPWLYPLYYVALLVPRQIDDERRCAAKYGPLWREYRRRVPWRIIPHVY